MATSIIYAEDTITVSTGTRPQEIYGGTCTVSFGSCSGHIENEKGLTAPKAMRYKLNRAQRRALKKAKK
jgi:hypothetical protein